MSETINIDKLLQESESESNQNVKNVSNEFLSKVGRSSGSKVLQRRKCMKKLKNQGYNGLISLFVAD